MIHAANGVGCSEVGVVEADLGVFLLLLLTACFIEDKCVVATYSSLRFIVGGLFYAVLRLITIGRGAFRICRAHFCRPSTTSGPRRFRASRSPCCIFRLRQADINDVRIGQLRPMETQPDFAVLESRVEERLRCWSLLLVRRRR